MIKEKPNIILLGGGGHCKSVIDVIEQQDKYRIKGILEPNPLAEKILNYPILGDDDSLHRLVNDDTFFIITVGQIKTASIRIQLASLLKKYNAKLATVISPLAYVSKHAIIDKGTIIMHKAIVNAGAKIGQHCIVNTQANIEHDVKVEDFCHISTSAIVNGNSVVGQKSFIGSNATISNGIQIDESTIVSAGKFVKK